MNKIAKENLENNLDHILLENSSNPKTFWKIVKMLIKSNKGSNCIPPLRNSINDENFDDIVYGDEDKCDLKSDSTHHFFRNVCTKSGSLRFSQFSGC